MTEDYALRVVELSEQVGMSPSEWDEITHLKVRSASGVDRNSESS